jgi:rod shape-determining protein MreC
MSLGTLDRTPPPFFRQGPSALTKLTFFSALALLLMVADTRFQITQPVRAVIATVLHPIERTLLVPVAAWEGGSDYLVGLQKALTQADAARRELTRQSERSLRLEQVEADNRRLRALLELRPALTVRSLSAEVLYDAPDPFSRKVIIDRGATHGVVIASPVVNESGVLGQVTRVYPLSSEVTLLNDKDAAIPVLNTRNQLRSAAFGVRNGMELRFMAGNADVQVGDLLSTSGVDGIYPPGLPVAKVTLVDRKIDTSFARIVLEPVGVQMPAKPEPAPEETKPVPKKGGRR